MLAALRLLLLASLTTTAVAAGCGSPIAVGGTCFEGRFLEGDCASEAICVNNVQGEYICQIVTPCQTDSECHDHFGCSLRYSFNQPPGAVFCATTCAEDSSFGCAAGYRCTKGGTCEGRTGESCYVTDGETLSCGVGAACSAVSRVCTVSPACTDSSSCSGFACNGGVCALSCMTDADCGPGFACNPQTLACSSSLGGPCDPASDDASRCGVGGACSPTTGTCMPAMPCTDEHECAGYGCQGGYCLLSCTANIVPCAVGSTCEVASHTCS